MDRYHEAHLMRILEKRRRRGALGVFDSTPPPRAAEERETRRSDRATPRAGSSAATQTAPPYVEASTSPPPASRGVQTSAPVSPTRSSRANAAADASTLNFSTLSSPPVAAAAAGARASYLDTSRDAWRAADSPGRLRPSPSASWRGAVDPNYAPTSPPYASVRYATPPRRVPSLSYSPSRPRNRSRGPSLPVAAPTVAYERLPSWRQPYSALPLAAWRSPSNWRLSDSRGGEWTRHAWEAAEAQHHQPHLSHRQHQQHTGAHSSEPRHRHYHYTHRSTRETHSRPSHGKASASAAQRPRQTTSKSRSRSSHLSHARPRSTAKGAHRSSRARSTSSSSSSSSYTYSSGYGSLSSLGSSRSRSTASSSVSQRRRRDSAARRRKQRDKKKKKRARALTATAAPAPAQTPLPFPSPNGLRGRAAGSIIPLTSTRDAAPLRSASVSPRTVGGASAYSATRTNLSQAALANPNQQIGLPNVHSTVDLRTSTQILHAGDWFYKWNRNGTAVHPRWVWVDLQSYLLVWSHSERHSPTFSGSVKLENISQIAPSELVQADEEGLPRTYYVLIIQTTKRRLQLATERRDKIDAWFEALNNVVAFVRRRDMAKGTQIPD